MRRRAFGVRSAIVPLELVPAPAVSSEAYGFRGRPVKDFLRGGATRRLHLERLPGYASELSLDEGIWNYLKRVELGNR